MPPAEQPVIRTVVGIWGWWWSAGGEVAGVGRLGKGWKRLTR